MIQQRLKKLYKSSPWFVRKTAILFFSLIVDIWAGLKRVHFPEKYNSEWASRLEMLSGNLEKETVALCKKILKPGMNAVDIGAHIGYYTMLFSKLVGKNGQVFAFEPEPENFQLLAENTGKYRNVKIFKKAISDKSGPLWFYRSEGKTACHSLLPADFRNEKIEVQAATLDQFLLENNSPKIDLIKLDIEGAEPYAVAGMRKLFAESKDTMLVFEFCPNNLIPLTASPYKFLEDLQQFGFNLYIIKNKGELDLIDLSRDRETIENLIRQTRDGYINIFCKK